MNQEASKWKYSMKFDYKGTDVRVDFNPPTPPHSFLVEYECVAKVGGNNEVRFSGEHIGPQGYWNGDTLKTDIQKRLDKLRVHKEAFGE